MRQGSNKNQYTGTTVKKNHIIITKIVQKQINSKVLHFILYVIVFMQISTILFGIIIMVGTTLFN